MVHTRPPHEHRPESSRGLWGPIIVKVLLRLIPDMLAHELVPLSYQGEGQSFHNQFDIIRIMNPFVFFIKDLDATLTRLF